MKSLNFFSAVLLSVIFIFSLQKLQAQKPDGPATHNMLVVGEKSVYLYHLPMFQEKGQPLMPHRYQVILETALSSKATDPQGAYIKDRQLHAATKIYTINPEQFVLPDIIAKDSLKKFKGTIFRGHLEKGGKVILSNIDVTIKHVIYFQQFVQAAKRTPQLEYILFGKNGELFLAHIVNAPPDFDQVILVNITGQTFTDDQLSKGIKIILPNSINSPSTRIKENAQADGQLFSGGNTSPQKIKIFVKREFYFEEGELRVPANFDRTSEEKKAGFL